MTIKNITYSSNEWERIKVFAEGCSWRAGKTLADEMARGGFSDWERVIAAFDGDEICGFCKVAKRDCIPGLPYTPYIGYIFVAEKYRGARLSEKMIRTASEYLSSLGFREVYLVSDHVGLYEKYGFRVKDKKIAPWGSEEKIYMKELTDKIETRCGLICGKCEYRESCGCGGCISTNGHPFHGECPVAVCCQSKGFVHCGECPELPCELLTQYSCDPEHGDKPSGARIEQCRKWAGKA